MTRISTEGRRATIGEEMDRALSYLAAHPEERSGALLLALRLDQVAVVRHVEARLRRWGRVRTAVRLTWGPTRFDQVWSGVASAGLGTSALLMLANGEPKLATIYGVGYAMILGMAAGIRLARGG